MIQVKNNLGWYEKVKIAGAASGHWTTSQFRSLYATMKEEDIKKADEKFEHVLRNPKSSGIHRILQNKDKDYDVYGVSGGTRLRALGVSYGSCFIWYWIGYHEDYNKMLKMPPPYGEIEAVKNYIKKMNLCGVKNPK